MIPVKDICPEPQPVFAAVAIFFVAIGLVGNAIVILLILVLKECSKSITNWYILQLAIADTLFLLMLPFTASSELSGEWSYGIVMCKIKEAILFINYYASIYFLVIMSFDRYLAVTKAFSSSDLVVALRGPRAAGIITAIGWVISIGISSPLFIYSTVGKCNVCAYRFPLTEVENSTMMYGDLYAQMGDAGDLMTILGAAANESAVIPDPINETSIFEEEDFNHQYFVDLAEQYGYNNYPAAVNPAASTGVNLNHSKEEFQDFENFDENQIAKTLIKNIDHTCKHSPNQYYFTWLKVNVSLFFCFPLLAMCCFYGLIIRAIVTTQAGAGRNEVQKYRNRVTVIVLALICLFLVSWLPWYTVQLALMNGISLSNSECKRLTYAVRLIAYLNSTLNPYFYGTLGGRFAERLRKARSKLGFVYTLSITSDTRRRARSWNNSARMANGWKDQEAPSGRLHIVENGKLSMGQRTERTAV
ncbi:uncharacterized protein LOC101242898 isoform X1 [Ciona intestinalis]